MVKIVELELNIDVNEDINAAIIQANVKPRMARIEQHYFSVTYGKNLPFGIKRMTRSG